MMKKSPITGRSRQLPWKDTFAYALPALSLAVIGIPDTEKNIGFC
jgi:hypothetical protein